MPCPTADELERLALGVVDEATAEPLERHLLSCAECVGRLAGVRADDTLFEALRAQATAEDHPGETSEQFRRLVERLEDLTSGTEASQLDATSGPPGVAGDTAAVSTSFLAPAKSPDEIGRLGGYRVLRVLGSGGMGVVFEAEDLRLKRHVALKVMKPDLAAHPQARQRFLREAQAMAALDHDHIVTIYQVGEDAGVPFLAMPFLQGESLDERLEREGSGGPAGAPVQGSEEETGGNAKCKMQNADFKLEEHGELNPKSKIENPKPRDGLGRPSSGNGLPLDEVLRIGSEIADGLAAAHERGLIHRDIKPGNIWLETSRGRTRVKILDFGLARATEGTEQLTQSAAVMGTPAYMAPEQARGEAIDARADLFSLGCVLYRVATGQRPFKGNSPLSVLMSLAVTTPPAPRELNPSLPAELDALIVSLLSKDPAGRPKSAVEVAERLASAGERRRQASGVRDQEESVGNGAPSGPRGVPIEGESESGRQGATEGRGDAKVNDLPLPPGEGRGGGRGATNLLAIGNALLASRSSRFPSRRRHAIALAAASFGLVVLAAVTVIVRDKDGKLLAWFKAGDGSTVEVSTSAPAERPLDEPAKSKAASVARPAAKLPDIAPPLFLVEPPPLAEWLKGHTELTVSQDGRGQFKSIQVALDALRPGQVVRVLDRGPYRENLYCKPPPDCGLVSDCGTIVDFAGPPPDVGEPGASYHSVLPRDTFRLNGFYFRAEMLCGAHLFNCPYAPGVVIESCVFQTPDSVEEGRHSFMLWSEPPEDNLAGYLLRDCVIYGSFGVLSSGNCKHAFTVVAQHNWFRGRDVNAKVGAAPCTFVFRQNVVDGHSVKDGWPSIVICGDGATGRFEVTNNTVRAIGLGVYKALKSPWQSPNAPENVIARNNIFAAPIRFDASVYGWLPRAKERWRVDHNLYLSPSSQAEELVNADTDVSDAAPFLIADPSDANYLRISAYGTAANNGAGGEWPNYIGAFPPGPAPKEGDWFTRLQERWASIGTRKAGSPDERQATEPKAGE